LAGEQEKNLPFCVGGNGAPALFVALDGLYRRAQELGKLFLGLAELHAYQQKSLSVHELLLGEKTKGKIPD